MAKQNKLDPLHQVLSDETEALRYHIESLGVCASVVTITIVAVQREPGEYDVKRSISACGLNRVTAPMVSMSISDALSLVLQTGLKAPS